jgi:hypothetical protein
MFGLEISNIPIINLRREFDANYALLLGGEFQTQINNLARPLKTTKFIWYGPPQELLTMLMLRAILGLESYALAAVEYEVDRNAISLSVQQRKSLSNPFALGGRESLPDRLYNKLPAFLGQDRTLCKTDLKLWQELRTFYKEVRNPLMHGGQLWRPDAGAVSEAYSLMARVFEWIDGWYSAFPRAAK